MNPIIYRSTDAGAPVLTGQVGTLVALLDACLVNGYGAKAAAGWTKHFAAANRGVYRPAAGPRHYLQVDDDGTIATAAAREARLLGFETMTALDTGTQRFPDSTTAACCRKSNTADATARPWILVADDRTFYLWITTGDNGAQRYSCGFGEFYSYLAGDTAKTIILYRPQNNATATVDPLGLVSLNAATATAGHTCPRGYTGLGAPVNMSKHQDAAKSGASTIPGVGIVPFPNPTDGGLYMCPFSLHDPTVGGVNVLRGRLRGHFAPLHPVTFANDGDTFSGAVGSEYAGRNFEVIGSNAQNGRIVVETTAWEISA